ncbi:S-adenosylmethionine decarboxylase [Sorangium sp. So ce1024]|jgi:S-adenosylmethionine/arginine decarboxylase-like enzyme|uniref:S-adenosylmethionine decarboxylase n=1 Tax=unclassified Sorangium TaxID=2621164 RepID=UPI003F0C6ECA
MHKARKNLTHFTMDGFHGFRSRFDDVKLAQELLEEVPGVLKLKPVMPPFILPYYNGVVAEDCGISAFVLLLGGHLTIHTFSFRECFFADLVYPGAFDPQRVQMMLQTTLPCRSVFTQTVDRGDGGDLQERRGHEVVSPEADFGPHLFLQFSPYRGPTSLDALFDIFDHLPSKIGMTPIMRPFVVKTATKDGSPVISAMVMIAESHITLHIFPDSDEAFFDLFSCKFFDVEPVVSVLAEQLGGNVTEQVLVPRGQRYLQLRTERPHVMSHVNQWLAAAHPGVYARMPGDGGPLGPKSSKG